MASVARPPGLRHEGDQRVTDCLLHRVFGGTVNGRNYEDMCDTIREFMRRGVVIRTVINNFTTVGGMP